MMGSTPTGTGVSGVDDIVEKLNFIKSTYLLKLGTLLAKIQEKLDQGENKYLQKCRRDITTLLTKLRIPKAEYSMYDMNQLLSFEKQSHEFINSTELSTALTQKLQVADVNQGPSFANPSFILPPPTPITGSHSALSAGSHSADNAVYGHHPNQKTDSPPRNTQDGLNTSSHAAALSVMGVASGMQDYSGYASYSTSYDPYGCETTGYQYYRYGYPQQANQPYTPQVGGPQNSGSPYQPLTPSTDDSQTTHWPKLNHPRVPSLISGILSRSLVSHTQPSPGTTSWQPQVDSSGTTSWNHPRSSSGMASWRPESISSATSSWKQVPTSWKPEPTPSNTTIWRPEPTSSSTISWGSEPTPSNSTSWKPVTPSTSWKSNPPPSSTTSWRQGPTSTSTMSWRPELTSSGLLTVQVPEKISMSWRPELTSSGLLTVQMSQVTGGPYGGYWRQGPSAFQSYPASSHTPSHFQNPLDSNPVHYENTHGLQQTACSQEPTSHFPATHPGAQTYTSLLQSGSSRDTRRANNLQVAMNPSILHFLDDDDEAEIDEELSKHDHKRRKAGI